ncbi:DUF5711 family protein [Fusibacter tunisiensis]|uniref:Uncharacterized protein n=1 Tax=Fusibacter tunisiensis TaxID=1008308 RepID=A0ABS2MNS5_9FIRM|nr:DUF5711 family protein [Fusibacter tunisiensis]MBM7560972.1 hypothetical protein [Fusibacter tunisiensis]
MKKGRIFSSIVLIGCLLLVFQFDHLVGFALKWMGEDFAIAQTYIFNQNDDFVYRGEIITLEDAYVIVDPTEMTYVNADGRALWTKKLASRNFAVSGGKQVTAIAEKKAGDIFLIDSEGDILASVLGLGKIDSITLYDDLYVSALKTDGEIVLLDNKLKLISNLKLPKGFLLDYDVNVDRQDIVASVLDLSRTPINSKLFLASIDGTITSGSNLNDEIGFEMYLIENGVGLISDSAFHIFDYKGAEINTVYFDRTVQQFCFHKHAETLWVNLVDSNSDLTVPKAKSEVIVYDFNGDTLGLFKPELMAIKGMTPIGENMILYNDTEVVLVNSAGEVLDVYSGKETIEKVHSVSDKGFAIEYLNELEVYVRK